MSIESFGFIVIVTWRYGVPVGMLKDILSPNSPHSALLDINVLNHAINATSQIRDPIPENTTNRLICDCSG